MISKSTLINTLILMLIIAVAGWLWQSTKTDYLEAETNKQKEKVREMIKRLDQNELTRDSLEVELRLIISKRKEDENILDSIRNAPNPAIDRVRTANPSELERYFIDRYK